MNLDYLRTKRGATLVGTGMSMLHSTPATSGCRVCNRQVPCSHLSFGEHEITDVPGYIFVANSLQLLMDFCEQLWMCGKLMQHMHSERPLSEYC